MKGTTAKRQALHQVVIDHRKNMEQQVIGVCPDTGEYIEVQPVEVNKLTKVLRFLGKKSWYYNSNKFLNSLRDQLMTKGIASLTEKQVDAVYKFMESKQLTDGGSDKKNTNKMIDDVFKSRGVHGNSKQLTGKKII